MGGAFLKEFKYFQDPLKNIEFTDEPCQYCGSEVNCIEGVYLDTQDEVSSVCLKCFTEGKVIIEISDYIIEKLYNHLLTTYPKRSKTDISEICNSLISELAKTPPVPWIQYNDWPVLNGDFMRYIGEWSQVELSENSPDGDGKKFLLEIIDDFTRDKIDDFDVFWNDIGEYTAIFVFVCIVSGKKVAIAQNY
jgi:Uncharacterised protein family (UPF0167)